MTFNLNTVVESNPLTVFTEDKKFDKNLFISLTTVTKLMGISFKNLYAFLSEQKHFLYCHFPKLYAKDSRTIYVVKKDLLVFIIKHDLRAFVQNNELTETAVVSKAESRYRSYDSSKYISQRDTALILNTCETFLDSVRNSKHKNFDPTFPKIAYIGSNKFYYRPLLIKWLITQC